MHVPKSAGSSVHVALERALPPGTMSSKVMDTSVFCCGFRDFDAFDPDLRAVLAVGRGEIAALSAYRVISGHFSLSSLLGLTSASEIATVLREPRARVLSNYAYWRLFSPASRSSYGGYQALDHARRPLDEFLTEPLVARATDNLVCRMLLGDDSRIPEVGFIAASDVAVVAEDAIGVLETLGYVGVLELGDSIWEGLSGFFGVPLSPICVNTTASYAETADAPALHHPVTLDTLRLLETRTAADAIVYRHALDAAGCSGQHANRLQAAAFASELVRIGDVAGTFAAQFRVRGRTIEELVGRVQHNDAEVQQEREQLEHARRQVQQQDQFLRETQRELAQIRDQLRWHQLWLDGIQGSASWRLTAPARAAKNAMRTLRVGGPVNRSGS
jgi:hypothetical protein